MSTDVATTSDDALFAQGIDSLTNAGVLGATWADFSSIIPPGEEGYDRYRRIGFLLGKSLSACKWWVADWLTFGEGAMGDRYSQAAEALGLSERTMQDYHWVGQNVPRSRRRADLTFSHHRAVAKRKVDPEQQVELLDLAARTELSVRDLEEEVKAIGGKESKPEWSGETVDEELLKRALDRRTLASAGYAVVRRAKPIVGGGWQVDDESMARLRAAVGEE